MDVEQAREIIKNNYPPENYTMLREALDWLLEQAEKVEALEKRLNELAQTSYCIICGDDATEVRQGRFYCHEC